MKIKASEVKVGMVFRSYFGWAKIHSIEKGTRKNGKTYYEFDYIHSYFCKYMNEVTHHRNSTGKGENTLVLIKDEVA